MGKLNSNQKKIIKDLRDTFSALNVDDSLSFNLIDIGEIKSVAEEYVKTEKEVEASNVTFRAMLKDAMEKDAESIREDVEKLGMTVEARNSDVLISKENVGCLRIDYLATKTSVKIGESSNKSKCVGFELNIGNVYMSNVKSFNEIINTETFKSKLKEMYRQSIK